MHTILLQTAPGGAATGLGAIGGFLTGVVTSAEASVVLPAVSLALLIAGLYWAFTHSEHGKTKAVAALIGGALAVMAPTLASGLSSIH